MPSLVTKPGEGIDSFWPEDMPLPSPSEIDDNLSINEGSLTDEGPNPEGGQHPAPARADDSSDSDGPPASDAGYIPHTPRSGGRERPGGGTPLVRTVPKTRTPEAAIALTIAATFALSGKKLSKISNNG